MVNDGDPGTDLSAMGPPMTQPRRSPITKRLAIQEPCSRLALISAPGCCS